MIFEVKASQVERLDADQIVSLLRKLVHAELQKHTIPLRSGSVPAQINIADGGEDGRVSWSGGPNQTDWLPCRYTVFQSKRGAVTPSALKREVWTKASQKTADARVLNDALVKALENSGSYIVATAKAVVGTKRDERIKAIEEGIEEAGHDPNLLATIDIFDSNKLAEWTNTHPSVALWLNTVLREVFLGGFQSFEEWAKEPELSEVAFQGDDEARFLGVGAEIRTWKNENPEVAEKKDLAGIRRLVADFFKGKGQAVRIVGPSGFGKTRLALELIDSTERFQDYLDVNQVIFCQYEDVKDLVINVARELADSGSQALLVVDDCPNAIHSRLSETVHRQGSNCHVVTTGVETTAQAVRKNLILQIDRASDELIGDIATAVNQKAKGANATLVRDLSQGFPRMAVHAARALEDGDTGFSSVEALLSRIVWGEQAEDAKAFESLQLASLFNLVGCENEAESELAELAEFVGRTSNELYADLSRFVERGVIVRQGDYAEVQPLPLAMRLANMWITSTPSGTLAHLFRHLSEPMKLRMVGRLRWVSWSDEVKHFARSLISEALPNERALDTDFGSKLLERFVHLAPDTTMDHLDRLLGQKTVDELLLFDSGRRHTVWALEKLVFRGQSFHPAASLLLTLGAAENERWANNATGLFTGLYQLYLSGTEAEPTEKLSVLDAGLSMSDDRVTKICLDALDKMLDNGHFSRSGGQEVIGVNEALEDWRPQTYDEIFSYYREALTRLEQIALSKENEEHSRIARNIIGSHIRGLIVIEPMFDEVRATLERLLGQFPDWTKPLMGVNEWLFFDREEASAEHQVLVREYYDELLPKSDIELLIFYSSGWATDVHDPDTVYDRDSGNDFEYSSRQVSSLIEDGSKSAQDYLPAMEAFLSGEFNSAWITVQKIAAHVDNPNELLHYLLSVPESDPELLRLPSFVSSVIAGVRQNNRSAALQLLDEALKTKWLEAHAVEFMAAAGLDDSLMKKVIEYVASDRVEPRKTQAIAFGDTLKGIDTALIERLTSVLCAKGKSGAWAAVDFLCYALHGEAVEDECLERAIHQATHNRALFEKAKFSNMDWYHWADLTKKLLDTRAPSVEACAELLGFTLHVIEVDDYSIQLAFDDYARKILRRLISLHPDLVWREFHKTRSNMDALKEHRLDGLFDADVGSPEKAGVLNEIPDDICITWMLEDKPARISFVLHWIEIFDNDAEVRSWSNVFVNFIEDHVDSVDMLDPVRSRLTSGVWWGSYANKLQKAEEELRVLRKRVKNPFVVRWIDRTLIRFEEQVASERRRDANREADFRK